MKKYYGTSFNVSTPILGVITRNPIWMNRRNFILITNRKRLPHGYAAVITNNIFQAQKTIPIVCKVEGVVLLNNGDIVSIDPDGQINILYDVTSPHNSLMVTGRCNCSCVMCPQPKVDKEDDKTLLNLKLISLMKSQTKCLGITGGEPTLLGDKLIDIISACKKHLPKTAITLLTNGVRFADKGYVQRLSAISHPDLVIDIPLYSDTDTEHDMIIGAKGFYKTIKGLYNLAILEQKIGIRIVIHRLNYQRLPQLAEFIYRNFPFVFHVAFMQMEIMGLANENVEKLWIDPYDYNNELEKAVLYLFQRDMNVSIYNTQLCILPPEIRRFARKSISLWKRSYIEKCNKCVCRNDCGGFFTTSGEKYSQHIAPI